jgi:phosphate/sulfate permease
VPTWSEHLISAHTLEGSGGRYEERRAFQHVAGGAGWALRADRSVAAGWMMSVEIVRHVLLWASVIVGFLAAGLWLVASGRVRVKDPENFAQEAIAADRGIALMDDEGTNVLETAKRQTRWNRWAAIATAISVALQAGALALSTIQSDLPPPHAADIPRASPTEGR